MKIVGRTDTVCSDSSPHQLLLCVQATAQDVKTLVFKNIEEEIW